VERDGEAAYSGRGELILDTPGKTADVETQAQRSFDNAGDTLKKITTTPSALDRLGKARSVFKAILEFGSAAAEVRPCWKERAIWLTDLKINSTAKMVFAICTKAWEVGVTVSLATVKVPNTESIWQKLEEQDQINENVRDLVDGLVGIVAIVNVVKEHTALEPLEKTIGDILALLEDVSIYVVERESRNSAGSFLLLHMCNSSNNSVNLVQTLKGFIDSSEREKVKDLLRQFEKLRAEFDRGVEAENHKRAYMLGESAVIVVARDVLMEFAITC
jgi:hypothetical protein